MQNDLPLTAERNGKLYMTESLLKMEAIEHVRGMKKATKAKNKKKRKVVAASRKKNRK